MPDNEMYTDEERRERQATWLADQITERRERFLAKRPEAFATPGELRPDLADWAQRFMAKKAGNLALVGNIGSGKSWSLWKLHETLIRSGFLGRFEIVPAHRLKQILTPPVDTVTLKAYEMADVLAFDDVAAIRVSDWDSDWLYALIDERWANRRPSVVASNVVALATVLGDRAASRFSDGVTLAKFNGPDLRGPR